MLKVDAQTSTIFDCKVVTLPRIQTESGAITALNNGKEIPFNTRRVYFLYDVPAGAERGGHAHRELFQLIVAACGSFDVIVDDGAKKQCITLNRPYVGLLIVPGIWRELENFSTGAVCLVLASELYSEADYIREYSQFMDTKYEI